MTCTMGKNLWMFLKRRADYIDYLRKGERRVPKYVALVSSCLKCCAQDSVVQDVTFIANDWQTGLLPVYHLYKYRRNNTYRNSRCVFVIHNIGYQAGMSAPVGSVPRFCPRHVKAIKRFRMPNSSARASIVPASLPSMATWDFHLRWALNSSLQPIKFRYVLIQYSFTCFSWLIIASLHHCIIIALPWLKRQLTSCRARTTRDDMWLVVLF